MTVAELVEELKNLDPNTEIYCSSGEGEFFPLDKNPFKEEKLWENQSNYINILLLEF